MNKLVGDLRSIIPITVLAISSSVVSLADSEEQQSNNSNEYLNHCAVCHGVKGHGDGPMTASLTTAPKNLTTLSKDNGGSFPETVLYQIIDGRRVIMFHGTREMPIWGKRFFAKDGNEELVNARIDEILRYLESIQIQ